MADTPQQSPGQSAPERQQAESSYGQQEFLRMFTAVLDQMRPKRPEPEPKALEAVESLKITVRQLAKPGVRPLPADSTWTLPPLNDLIRGSVKASRHGGPGKKE